MISGTIAGRQSVTASLAAVQVLHGTVHGNGVIAGAIVNEREVSGVICVEQLARGTLGIPRVIGGDVYDGRARSRRRERRRHCRPVERPCCRT